jgi:hypothetical protein
MLKKKVLTPKHFAFQKLVKLSYFHSIENQKKTFNLFACHHFFLHCHPSHYSHTSTDWTPASGEVVRSTTTS